MGFQNVGFDMDVCRIGDYEKKMKRIQYLDRRSTTLHYLCQWILHLKCSGLKVIWQRFCVIYQKRAGGQCLILFWCTSSASPITFLLSIYLSASFLSSLFVTDSSFLDLPFPSVILSPLLYFILSLPYPSSRLPLLFLEIFWSGFQF